MAAADPPSRPAAPSTRLGLVADRIVEVAPVDEALLARAHELRPALAADAARAEAERRVPDEHLKAMEAAGLFDVMAPRRAGGIGSLSTQLAVSSVLARGCPSSAWLQTIFSTSRWWVATLASDQAQEEILGGPEPALVSGVVGASGPAGTATPVDGGFLVSGKWPFASGCLHANWSILGVAFLDADGNPVDDGIVLAPLDACRVEDTWHVAGMAATGSNTVVADKVFVPDHRAVRGESLLGAGSGGDAPSDRWPFSSVLALVLMGPILGMAQEVLQAVADGATRRGISYSTYARQVDSVVVVRDIAKASLDLDTAFLHIFRAAADIEGTGFGSELDDLARARLRGSLGYVSDLVRQSTATLMDIAGASAFANFSPLQRLWRDLNAASRHAFLGTQPTLEMYGRAVYGLESPFPVI